MKRLVIRMIVTLALAAVGMATFPSCVSGDGPQAQSTAAPEAAISAATPTVMATSTSTLQLPTSTSAPTSTPTATPQTITTPTPTANPIPEGPDLLRLPVLQAKQAILDIVNSKRAEIGIPALTLGTNVVAQIHAQSSLDNCFVGHWDKDGLHVNMQYSLAGGYQVIEAGLSGLSYCRHEESAEDLADELRSLLNDWMSTPGHSLVNPRAHRMNIGIAYDDYNLSVYAILEGDYVEYTDLPKIENDSLIISGSTKHDVRFDAADQLGIQVLYDPPPEPLTIGQLSRGACYSGGGLPIAVLIPPRNVGIYQSESPVEYAYVRCTAPREISPDMPAPQSIGEARSVYNVSWNTAEALTTTIPQIRSSNWVAGGNQFAVSADIGNLLEEHGAGVYTVLVWGGDLIISHYSIFHGITPPDTYGPTARIGPTPTAGPTATVQPVTTPTPTLAPTPDAPNLRHLAAKQAMLDIVNAKRAEAGFPALTLGSNIAAQIHAQSSLDNCFTGYWGTDGLALYMQYSLAGGYQAIDPGLHGLNFCLLEQPPGTFPTGLRDVLDDWLSTPGNLLLSPRNHQMNIGIAYGNYNLSVYAILEGDYVEYTDLPKIENDSLIISGSTKHDVRFDAADQLGIQVLYDPPPEPLTIGQLSRGACFTGGGVIAVLIPPGNVGYYQSETPILYNYLSCKPPREVPANRPAPVTIGEARIIGSTSSRSRELYGNYVPRIRSSKWEASGNQFAVSADIGDLLEKHGAGVYTVWVSHYTDDEERIISQYSIFHGITPPDTYSADLPPAR